MEGYDAEIFVQTSFEEETFVFGDVQQRLLCSKAATTDYDLTGLVVWPASQILAWYVVQTRHIFEGKHVLEVGAGCGLTGFVAAQYAAHVSFTDGNPRILDLLRKTCELNGKHPPIFVPPPKEIPVLSADLSSHLVNITSLSWGDADSVQQLIDTFSEKTSWPTVFLGADVFQTSFGSPALLFATIKRLFRAAREHGVQEECAFYACFALRATTKEDLIEQCAREEGFALEKLCIRDMLPKGVRPDDFTREKLRLIKYTLNP